MEQGWGQGIGQSWEQAIGQGRAQDLGQGLRPVHSQVLWQSRITLRLGSRGPAVADLRWRLARLGYPAGPGEASSGFDAALEALVRTFQADQGLAPDGVVGPATWRRLYALTSPAQPARTVTYPTASPAPGPALIPLPDDRPRRPGADPTPGLAGAGILAAARAPRRAHSPWAPASWAPAAAHAANARIEVHLHRRVLLLYTPEGTARFPVAVGRPDAPTPTGRFAVAELIPHPGSPLGTRWIRLHPDMLSIHGTDEPWLVGGAATPGCLRLYNKDVEYVFHRVAPGTPVDVQP